MTNQETFDRVAAHLLNQGERSYVGEACAYRGKNGLKCAVGCLIPDDRYTANIEGVPVCIMLAKELETLLGFPVSITQVNLLQKLQEIHDQDAPARWPRRLVRLAERYALTVSNDLAELAEADSAG